MRAIVIGADGLIGNPLAAALQTAGHSVVRTSRRRERLAEAGVVSLDLADTAAADAPLPVADIAFFCAGMTRFADCRADPARSQLVNVTAPAAIARRLVEKGTRVVLLSTSAVLDCREPRMSASRPYAPRGVYGMHKAAAEERFLELAPRAAVLRLTKVVAPQSRLLTEWLRDLSQSRPIHAFTDVRISPLRIDDVTGAALALAERGAAGIYQVSGAGDVSYAEIAHHLARKLGVPEKLIDGCLAAANGIPADEITAYTSLDPARLVQLAGFAPPSPFAVIDEVLGPRLRA